jgi:hypothetical protein
MSGIFTSSCGGNLFLHIGKLEWFKRKLIGVDGNVNLIGLRANRYE